MEKMQWMAFFFLCNFPICLNNNVFQGFYDVLEKVGLIGRPVKDVRLVLLNGRQRAGDSSKYAFVLGAPYGFRVDFLKANTVVLEPIMNVSVTAPIEFQGTVIGNLNKRKGTILDTDVHEDYFVVTSEVSLNNMFGYSSDLRSATQVYI